MSTANKVNRRQFVLMRKPFEAEGFKVMNLSNGFYLSYDNELKVTMLRNAVLLGNAYSVYGGVLS